MVTSLPVTIGAPAEAGPCMSMINGPSPVVYNNCKELTSYLAGRFVFLKNTNSAGGGRYFQLLRAQGDENTLNC